MSQKYFFSTKNFLFWKYFFCQKKAFLLVLPIKEISLGLDQSSPGHPVSESRRGSTSVTKDEQTDKICVSNIG